MANSIDEKIKQCKKDIESLKENLKELEEQKRKENQPKFGDIVDSRFGKRIVLFSEEYGRLSTFAKDGVLVGYATDKSYTSTGQNIFDVLNLDR